MQQLMWTITFNSIVDHPARDPGDVLTAGGAFNSIVDHLSSKRLYVSSAGDPPFNSIVDHHEKFDRAIKELDEDLSIL